MSFYDFTTLNQAASTNVATEALQWGDISLDSELLGYRTLRVDARHDSSTNIESILVNHRNRFKYMNYDMQNVEVVFMIEADNNSELNKRITQFKNTIRGEEVPFKIADEIYHRVGTVTSITFDEQTSQLQITGKFTIKTMTAFKETDNKTLDSTKIGNPMTISDPDIIVDGVIHQIRFVNDKQGKPTLKIVDPSGKTKQIKFINDVKPNAIVTMNMGKAVVNVSGQSGNNQLGWVDINTPLSSLRIKNGSKISMTGVKSFKVEYAGEVL